MSEFGYIPESLEVQSQSSNAGIFTPKDIYNLDIAKKWSSAGELELIETNSATSSDASVVALDFENIRGSEFDTHFITIQSGRSNGYQYLSLRFGVDGSYTTSGYRYARQQILHSTYSEDKSTSSSHLRIGSYVYKGENAYATIQNLHKDDRYVQVTSQMAGVEGNNSDSASSIGIGNLPTPTSYNCIRVCRTSGVGWYEIKASLYGVRNA
jgi:hypothetical protein